LPEPSCRKALLWRLSLGDDATQADAWRLCKRGDWLVWQWHQLPPELRIRTQSALLRALHVIVERGIKRGRRVLRGSHTEPAKTWRRWARAWLSGDHRVSAAVSAAAAAPPEDRLLTFAESPMVLVETVSEAAASLALIPLSGSAWGLAGDVSESAATAAWLEDMLLGDCRGLEDEELRLQAVDIRREIPLWPG
jgi:hypothetical protein